MCRFNYLCLSEGQTAVVYEDPVGASHIVKHRETQPTLPTSSGKGKEWWVWTRALEVLVLGLKCGTTESFA